MAGVMSPTPPPPPHEQPECGRRGGRCRRLPILLSTPAVAGVIRIVVLPAPTVVAAAARCPDRGKGLGGSGHFGGFRRRVRFHVRVRIHAVARAVTLTVARAVTRRATRRATRRVRAVPESVPASHRSRPPRTAGSHDVPLHSCTRDMPRAVARVRVGGWRPQQRQHPPGTPLAVAAIRVVPKDGRRRGQYPLEVRVGCAPADPAAVAAATASERHGGGVSPVHTGGGGGANGRESKQKGGRANRRK